jgi:hypothetical protein
MREEKASQPKGVISSRTVIEEVKMLTQEGHVS